MKRTQPPRRTHRTLGSNRIDDAWSSSSEMADYGGLPAKESQIGQRFHVSRSRRKWLSMLEKCTAEFLWLICVKLFESILFLSCFGFCFHLMNQREVLTTFPTIQNHRVRLQIWQQSLKTDICLTNPVRVFVGADLPVSNVRQYLLECSIFIVIQTTLKLLPQRQPNLNISGPPPRTRFFPGPRT